MGGIGKRAATGIGRARCPCWVIYPWEQTTSRATSVFCSVPPPHFPFPPLIPRELFKKIRHVEVRTRGLVDDVFGGEYHSAFKGRGIEFAEVRPYQIGDDVRTIDWNVSARTGEPHVKLFEEEREQTLILVVDVSGSESFGSARSKRDLAAEVCAVLGFSALRNHDKVGLVLFSDRVERAVPAKRGKRHVLRLVRDLFAHEPIGKGTDIAGAIDHVLRVQRRRAIVVLVSDFLVPSPAPGRRRAVAPHRGPETRRGGHPAGRPSGGDPSCRRIAARGRLGVRPCVVGGHLEPPRAGGVCHPRWRPGLAHRGHTEGLEGGPRHAADGRGLRRTAVVLLPKPDAAMSVGKWEVWKAKPPSRTIRPHPRGRTDGRSLRVALVIAVAMLCAASASAQTARLTVLEDSATTGEPFEVAVTVRHAPGQQTAFPVVPAGGAEARPRLEIGDAIALEVERFPPRRTATARIDSAVYRVVTFAADTARVGPVEVTVTDGGEVIPLATGSAVVPVRSVLEGESPPYEPAPFGDPEPFPSAAPVWIALGMLAALVIRLSVWGVIRLLRRPRGHVERADPYQVALARLGVLDADAPQTPEAVEAFVVEVRSVVRRYLERRLRVPAATSTTGDLEAVLEADARLSDASVGMVRHVLRPTDLVAFARVRPAGHVAAQMRDQARAALEAVEADVVRSETPVEVAPS